MTKEQLLANIRDERATFDALVSSLSDGELVAPELEAGWSVKDVLAHISAWERLCLKWIREGRREEGPLTQESIDAFNDGIYHANHARALDLVRLESRGSCEAMVLAVEALTGDLDAPPPWASDEFTGGTTTATLGQIVSANSDEHYREHIDQIESWLRSRLA
jgi:uncharacterized damage-inducible protein DinB